MAIETGTGNCGRVPGELVAVDRDDDLAAFDRLPMSVKRVLHAGAFDVAAPRIEGFVRDYGAEPTAAAVGGYLREAWRSFVEEEFGHDALDMLCGDQWRRSGSTG